MNRPPLPAIRFPAPLLGASLLALLSCSSSSDDDQASPAASRTLEGELATADGASAQDYLLLGASPETTAGVSPGSDGAFRIGVKGEQTSLLLAVPRTGTPSAERYQEGKGLYLSPVFGPVNLVANAQGGLSVGSGRARIDSTTTVLALLLVHPMLAHPHPERSAATARWLVDRFNSGWPEARTAVESFERALEDGGDLAAGPFEAAMGALVTDLAAAPFETAMGASASDPGAALHDTLSGAPAPFSDLSRDLSPDLAAQTSSASHGATQIRARLDDPKAPSLKLENDTGTNLDYLCVVRPTDPADFPDGAQSPNFLAANRLRAGNANTPIRSVFLPAKSYASYLDVVGNAIGLVTQLIGGATIGPNSAIPLAHGAVTEVRCFSGGYGAEADQPVSDFIDRHFRSDARGAFVHNVTAATIEVFSALPGGDSAAKSDIGKQVLAKVIQQTVAELEAKASSQGSRLDAADIYEIIYNVSRAGLNELCNKASEEWRTGHLEKLQHFVKWGGKSLVRFINVTGRLANAGAAGSRAYALASPQSLLEYFLFAVDGASSKPDAGVSPDLLHAREDVDKWLRGCRQAVDAGCIVGTLYCPGNLEAATQDHPDHGCAVALGECLLGAGTSCARVDACLESWAYCGD